MKHRLNEKTAVFSAASSTSPVVAELQPGDEVEVGEAITNGLEAWRNVTLSDGVTGYISAKSKGSGVGSAAPSATPAANERIVVVVPQLNLDGITRTVGDLVFTNRRVFLSKTAGNADLAQAFGLVGAAVAAVVSRDASQQLQAQPLDTILAAADPRARFEYQELQGITVKLGRFFSTPTVRLIPRQGKRVKLWGKRGALKQLGSSVSVLKALGAPISLS